jgi:hypothetical protein
MATRYKILGQVAPTANIDTNVYTVPNGKDTVISTIVIANRSAVNATYRIAIRPGGANIQASQYVAFDIVVTASDSTAMTLGLTVSQSDIVSVRSSSGDLTFSLFGTEIDI